MTENPHEESAPQLDGNPIKIGTNEEKEQLWSMKMALIQKYPKTKDVHFDLKCGNCHDKTGPPEISCSDGHNICWSCYDKMKRESEEEEKLKCPAEYVDYESKEKSTCNKDLFGVNDTIRNTKYFRWFLENSKYSCGMRSLGCEAVCSGLEIKEHETEQCEFKLLRMCQFGDDGCDASFRNLGENLQHLITEHQLSISFNASGKFQLRYDRADDYVDEVVEEDAEGNRVDHGPLIRAIITGRVTRGIDVLCLLMAKDVGEKTRVWVVQCETENQQKLEASICVGTGSSLDKFKECKINIYPNLWSFCKSLPDQEGYFVDFSHEYLDSIAELKEPGKYFTLLCMVDAEELADQDGLEEGSAKGEKALKEREGENALAGDRVLAYCDEMKAILEGKTDPEELNNIAKILSAAGERMTGTISVEESNGVSSMYKNIRKTLFDLSSKASHRAFRQERLIELAKEKNQE